MAARARVFDLASPIIFTPPSRFHDLSASSATCCRSLRPRPPFIQQVPLFVYCDHYGFGTLRAWAPIRPAIQSHRISQTLSSPRTHQQAFRSSIPLPSHHFDIPAIVKDGSSPLEGAAGGADVITCTTRRVYGFLVEGDYQPGPSRAGARPISCGTVWRCQED